jgi:hypothetical protein
MLGSADGNIQFTGGQRLIGLLTGQFSDPAALGGLVRVPRRGGPKQVFAKYVVVRLLVKGSHLE